MAPIPESTLPGHKRLHERAVSALELCQESQGVEFKESAPWDTLKVKLTRTSMAMANLRDGGIIIVGVSQRGDSWELTGTDPTHLASYDVDVIVNHVNSFATPHVDLDIVTVDYVNGKRFLVIQSREFAHTPIVCKKNGPAGSDIKEGDVYVRTAGAVQTTRIMRAADMHDLLTLAAEKRAREILEQGRRVGLVPSTTAGERFARELEDL
jgi:predicted HTH transcriptional regulator